MAKQSTPANPNLTDEPESLEQRLAHHPELKAKIEALLAVVENAQGDVVKANDAEQRVIEEIRQLGQAALQGWASRQNQAQSDQWLKAQPQVRRSGQKNSTGTVASASSKS